ncbi:hypothetical protein FACS1894133_4820 [Clostridia bacterium]|nr:hypothetical protein FACS1894133_4820 [Clostridia bacterium]
MTVDYNITLDEATSALAVFERKYYRLKWTGALVLYAGLFGFALFLLVTNGFGNIIYYLVMGIAGYASYQVWSQPNKTRRRIRQVYETSPDESYRAEFTEDGVNVITLVKTAEGETREVPTFIKRTEQQYFTENEKLIILIVNKSLTYVFPKRCLSEDEQTKVREYFKRTVVDYV